jgi:uncharacterized membrane protein YjjP (DUF1212 family)
LNEVKMPDESHGTSTPILSDALDCLLRFGALMLCAGNAAFRVRQWMRVLGRAMNIDALAVHIALGGMTATARRGNEHVTLASEIAPIGINTWRIGALEHVARAAGPGVSTRTLASRLDVIESEAPLHSVRTITAAMGVASGAFSYLNGASPLVVFLSLLSASIGQATRSWLARRRINQYAIATICAVVASGTFSAIAMTLGLAGFAVPLRAAGFISSVLFLVAGFPLIAALLDLLRNQIVAGVARLAYAGMVLVAAAFGLSLVANLLGLTAEAPPFAPLSEATTILLRAAASAVGGCGFAILYNSSWRTVLTVGVLSLIGNELRLTLHDTGLALPVATFLGALAVGLLAALVRHRMHEPSIALTVPGVIIMVPGTYAFQAVVLFGRGDALAGLKAAVLGGFVVGAMAIGLAVARLITDRTWRKS